MVKNSRFDPAFITPKTTGDLDEVAYLKLYGQEKVLHKNRPEAKKDFDGRPLIDIVTPQPKAFYAYLRMPKTSPESSSKKAATGRVKRTRKKVV